MPARDYDWVARRRTSRRLWETGMAIIAVRPGAHAFRSENPLALRNEPRALKRPRLMRFAEALPRSAPGKINKPALRPQYGSPEAAGTTQAAGW